MEMIVPFPVELRTLRKRANRRQWSRVVLAFPHEGADERAINRGLQACGCEVGSIFLMTALVVLVLAFVAGWRTSWWNVTAIVFGAALAGKITGLVVAELRLRSVITRLVTYGGTGTRGMAMQVER